MPSPASAASCSSRFRSSRQKSSLTAAFLASRDPAGAPRIDSAALRSFFWVAFPSSCAIAFKTAVLSAVVRGTTTFFLGAGFAPLLLSAPLN